MTFIYPSIERSKYDQISGLIIQIKPITDIPLGINQYWQPTRMGYNEVFKLTL